MSCIPRGEVRNQAERGAVGVAKLPASEGTMATEQNVTRAKVGLLEIAKQLGNISQVRKMIGYSRDSFYRSKELGAARRRKRPSLLSFCLRSTRPFSCFLSIGTS